VEFRALGLLEVVADDGRLVEVAPGKESALLGFLLLHGNEALSPDRIVDALWDEGAPENARKSVQIYVSHLRKKLGADRIDTTAAGYRLRVEADEVDVHRFELFARNGAKALERGDVDGADRIFDEALALWRGDAFADFRFESFAQVEIRRLEELRDAAVADRLDARIAGGGAGAAIAELEALVVRRPLWERPRAQLMRALYLSGRQADALELYRETRTLLRDELGVEPGPGLQSLEHAILTHDPDLGQPARPPVRVVVGVRRAAALLVAGGLLVAIAAAAVAFELERGGGRRLEVAANSVVAIDPSTDRIVAQFGAGTRPSRLAAASGTVWALSAGDGTITEIDGRQQRRVGDFGPASAPTDLAATASLLWVGNAPPVARTPLSGAEGPASLSRFTHDRHVLLGMSPLPHHGVAPVSGRPPEARLLVAGNGLAWAVAPDSSVVGVDSKGRVRHRVPVQAVSLAYGDDGFWILTQQNEVIRVDPFTGRVTRTIAIPSFLNLGGIAVGAGSVWVTSPFQGSVWRVDPGPPSSLRTIPLSFGAATIAFGAGAVWIGNNFDDTIERVDPSTNIARKVASIPSPQDITVAADRVWVAAGSASGRSGPVASGACGHVVQAGTGHPNLIVASDFALEGGSSLFSQPMEHAVEAVFRANDFRAGRFTVGLQSCDDASRAAGGLDIGQCLANGRAYALDSTVVGVIGDESPCATAQIPILNRAPHGPIALISPTSTSPFLTTPAAGPAGRGFAQLYAGGVRNFARTVGADQLQVVADARLASRLHLRRIGIVYNRLGLTSQAELRWFQEAAQQDPNLHVIPVTWNENGAARLERAVRAAHVEGAFLTGAVTQGSNEGVEALVALHKALPAGAPVIVTDWLAPWPSLKAARSSYDGVYATVACPTLRSQLAQATRALLQHLPRHERIPCAVAPAVQAAEAMLDAIARSDGTRSSITRALLTSGLFDANGDLLNAPVTVFRLRRGARNGTGLPYFQDATVDSVLRVPRFVPSAPG
jgi:DNA-binding SARP family transcriptional activator